MDENEFKINLMKLVLLAMQGGKIGLLNMQKQLLEQTTFMTEKMIQRSQ